MQQFRNGLVSYALAISVLVIWSTVITYYVLRYSYVVIFLLILLGTTAIIVKMARIHWMSRLISFLHLKDLVLAPFHMFSMFTNKEREVFTMNRTAQNAIVAALKLMTPDKIKLYDRKVLESLSPDLLEELSPERHDAVKAVLGILESGSQVTDQPVSQAPAVADDDESAGKVGAFDLARKSFGKGFSMLGNKTTGGYKRSKNLVVRCFTGIKDAVVWCYTKIKDAVVGSYTGTKNFVVWSFTTSRDVVRDSYDTVRTWIGDRHEKVWTTFWMVMGFMLVPLGVLVLATFAMYLTLPRGYGSHAAPFIAKLDVPVSPNGPVVLSTVETKAPMGFTVAPATQAPEVPTPVAVAVKTEAPAEPVVPVVVETPTQPKAPEAPVSKPGRMHRLDKGLAGRMPESIAKYVPGS